MNYRETRIEKLQKALRRSEEGLAEAEEVLEATAEENRNLRAAIVWLFREVLGEGTAVEVRMTSGVQRGTEEEIVDAFLEAWASWVEAEGEKP